ncbi:MAG: alpha/beta hydrolase [Pseudomonadota bacterium]
MEPAKTFVMRGDGVDIQLAEWPGSGQTILAVHGLTANLRCFETLAAGLQGRHHLLAMDLRGRGLSGKPGAGYSLDHHCRDIRAVLGELGLTGVTLMGHSLGAYISLAFAALHPGLADRLILLDGGGELSAEQWAKVGVGVQPSVDRLGKVLPSLGAYLEQVRQAPYYDPWSPAIENYFRYELEEVAGGGVRSRTQPANIAEERANLAGIQPSRFYPLIKCPVLVVRAVRGMSAPENLVLPPDALVRMQQAMPQARAVELADADHFSLIFQPNPARDRAILDFMAA